MNEFHLYGCMMAGWMFLALLTLMIMGNALLERTRTWVS